jgi:hypothetical protein
MGCGCLSAKVGVADADDWMSAPAPASFGRFANGIHGMRAIPPTMMIVASGHLHAIAITRRLP